MKVREVISLVEADGWYLVRTRGAHRQYKHPTKLALVTIAGHRNVGKDRHRLEAIDQQAEPLRVQSPSIDQA
jgi:predicted RNA binding protein YcfA (HicA-like mRNA interferase family)